MRKANLQKTFHRKTIYVYVEWRKGSGKMWEKEFFKGENVLR